MLIIAPFGKSDARIDCQHNARALVITLALMTFVLLAAGCSPTISQHGHRISDEDLARIEPGVTDQRDVLSLLGSPSAQATFETDRWYYVTQRTERTSFYQEELTQQDVVTVTFAQNGTVDAIEKHGLDQANNVVPSDDKTKTLGNELSLVEQLLGNIGRFNSGVAETP